MPNRRDYSFSYPGSMSEVYNGINYYYADLISAARVGSRVATDYNRKKPVGPWLPATNYSMIEIDQEHPKGVMTRRHKDAAVPSMAHSGYLYYGSTVGTMMSWPGQSVSETAPGDLANRALIKARLKLKNQDINLGVAFGERRKVAVQMFRTAKTLADAFSALKRGHFRDAAKKLGIDSPGKATGTLASQWLAMQYGWKPLLSDVHGAVLALEKRNSDDWLVTVKASANETRKDIGEYNPNNSTNGYFNHHAVYGAFCRIDAVPSNSAVATAASLGLLNPLSIAWELLPFSFIVDWFVPIGDYINQFDALAGWDIRGYSMSTLTKVRWKWAGINWPITPTHDWDYVNNWRASRSYTAVNRTAGGSVPFPVLPSIKDPVSGVHVANALALLRAAFR